MSDARTYLVLQRLEEIRIELSEITKLCLSNRAMIEEVASITLPNRAVCELKNKYEIVRRSANEKD